jgi:hypothetical protein
MREKRVLALQNLQTPSLDSNAANYDNCMAKNIANRTTHSGDRENGKMRDKYTCATPRTSKFTDYLDTEGRF